jgi:putative transposase
VLFRKRIQPYITRLIQSLCGTLRIWTKPITDTPLVGAATDLARNRRELMLENALLRQQLLLLNRQVKRPKLHGRDRVVIIGLASRLATWKNTLVIVKPETVLRWHRDLFRRVWRRRSQAKKTGGRPRLASEQVALIRRIAHENLTWGAERIRGELLKLGLPIAKSTIQHYLKGRRAAGPGSQTWRTFLRNHAAAIWACDFLQLHDIWFRDLFVFVIIELASRRVVHIAVSRHPSDRWAAQQLREATPFGEGPRFLIRDNDDKYGLQFDRTAAGVGIKILRTPIAAPRANSFCERFLGSLRRECLDYVLIFSEQHLLHCVTDYVAYFNQARPHQGIGQRIPDAPVPLRHSPPDGAIVGLPVLNGLHHDYQRRAA